MISRICYTTLLLSAITYVSAVSSGSIWTSPGSWFLGHIGYIFFSSIHYIHRSLPLLTLHRIICMYAFRCFCEHVIVASDARGGAQLTSTDCNLVDSGTTVTETSEPYQGSIVLSSYILDSGFGSILSAVLPYVVTSQASVSSFSRMIQGLSAVFGLTMRFATCGAILAIDSFAVITSHMLFRFIIYYW